MYDNCDQSKKLSQKQINDIDSCKPKYKVCKYFDDVYEKTIARGLTYEEAKQIKDEANTKYGHDYTSYEIKNDD